MPKEYGGYIELESFHGKEYHEEALALNSGRHCLEYLLRAEKIEKLYLPYFLCSSVKNVCNKMNLSIEYYHIDNSFRPIFEKNIPETERIYIVNYYGQLSNKELIAFKQQFGEIIVDNVQAFFQRPISELDTIYTCRKFFGVSDGAYLYTKNNNINISEQDFSYDRMHFLLGRYEKGASLFYDEYTANNRFFNSEPIKKMSKLTHNLLKGIDYDHVISRRTENFEYMHQRFHEINKLDLIIPSGAYMYPLYIENGSEIRKHLQLERIYIPTLWPDVFDNCDSSDLEYNMASNILPLPIDQRYDLNDMEYIADEVEKAILSLNNK